MRRGATLAELVLSLALLLLVVLFIFELYPMSMASLRLAGQRVQANALADSVLADWMQRPFSSLAVGPGPPLAQVAGQTATFLPSLEILAVNQPGVDPTQIRALRVHVKWTDHNVGHELIRQQWRTDVRR